MASLSLGTRNLKFMQRAAAKSGTGPAEALPRAAIAAEEDAKWVLPRSSTKRIGEPAGVSFESSYAPFLGFGAGEGEEDKGEGSIRRAGGGRITFGDFGKDEEVKEDEDEEDEDEMEDRREEDKDHRRREKEAVRVRREKLGKLGREAGANPQINGSRAISSAKRRRSHSPPPPAAQAKPAIPPTAHVTAQGFVRPSNYTEPSTSSASSTAPPAKKISTAERLKQIAKSRAAAPNTTSAATPASAAPSTTTPAPPLPASSSPSLNPDSNAAESSTAPKSLTRKARKRLKQEADRAASAGDAAEAKGVKVEISSSPAPTAQLSPDKATLPSSPIVPASSAAPTPSTGAGLDAREKELKAQRKREAKARRKEKKAQGTERSR